MGFDGLWRAVDQSISLWDIDANLDVFATNNYGPYTGWAPVAITAGVNNYTYVLWNFQTGAAALWLVDPNLNLVGGIVAGPYVGWTAESLSTGTSSTNLRLLWKRSDGMLAVWSLDQSLNVLASVTYGPYLGYNPAPVGQATKRSPLAVERSPLPVGRRQVMPALAHSKGEAVRRADQLMGQHSASRKLPVLPKP